MEAKYQGAKQESSTNETRETQRDLYSLRANVPSHELRMNTA